MTLPTLHPACAVWDQMTDKQLKELSQDIKEVGLRDKMVMFLDLMLEGRNRWLGLEILGIDPRAHIRQFGSELSDGDDPVRFAMSKNMSRRHATPIERILAAAGYANLKPASNQYSQKMVSGIVGDHIEPVTQQEAADKMGVKKKQVEDGKALLTHAAPNVITMVKAGKLALTRASRVVKSTPKNQQLQWSVPNDVPKIRKTKKTEPSTNVVPLPNYSYPCIPDNLKEVKITQPQKKTIESIHRHFKDRRSQRILLTYLEGVWSWLRAS